MPQTREAITENLAERLCWRVAQRDDSRVARRLYRKQVVDGVYPLDAAAVLDEFFHFLRELGIVDLLEDVRGKGIQRALVPLVQYVLLYGLKTLFGIEHCCIKASKQHWSLGHPPQKTEQAVRVHVVFTRRMFALATADRGRCEQIDTGEEPVGWQRWRRQLLQ